jgi:hypothetical protein
MEPSSLRRRAAPVLLVVAALVVGYLLRDAPREQEIELSFQGSREHLTKAELRLVGQDGEEDGAARWSWAPGKAPAVVRSRVKAAPGRWRLFIRLETAGGPQLAERTVALQGEPVRVALRVE